MSAIETEIQQEQVQDESGRIPLCSDLDEDCEDIEDHLGCWLYDMGKGRCPYCSSCKDK